MLASGAATARPVATAAATSGSSSGSSSASATASSSALAVSTSSPMQSPTPSPRSPSHSPLRPAAKRPPKRQRLPLVNMGRSFCKRGGGSGGGAALSHNNMRAFPCARGVADGSASVGANVGASAVPTTTGSSCSDEDGEARMHPQHGLLAALPKELVVRILAKYVFHVGDLLAVRASCFLGDVVCRQILSARRTSLSSDSRGIRVATMWCRDTAELHVEGLPLTDNELCNVARGLRKLHTFSARRWGDVTAHGLGMFFSFLNELKHLDLRDCEQLDDWALTRLAERCPRLQTLRLRGCSGVGADGVEVVARHCSLVELDLAWCAGVNRSAVHALIASPSAPTLRRLSLAGCAVLDDAMVRWLAHRCDNLEALDVSHAPRISDLALRALAHSCKGRLRELNLAGCAGVRSAGVMLIVCSCLKLTALDISGCEHVADYCFLCLEGPTARLEALGLERCLALSARGVAAARRRFPAARLAVDELLSSSSSSASSSSSDSATGGQLP